MAMTPEREAAYQCLVERLTDEADLRNQAFAALDYLDAAFDNIYAKFPDLIAAIQPIIDTGYDVDMFPEQIAIFRASLVKLESAR